MSQIIGQESAEIRAVLTGLAIHNGLRKLRVSEATYREFLMADDAWAAVPADWVIDPAVQHARIVMVRGDGTVIGHLDLGTLSVIH